MFYVILPCIFIFLAAALLPAVMHVIAAARERRHAPPPPPRSFRPIVIQGGRQAARETS